MATVAIVIPIYATSENGRLNLLPFTLKSVRNQNLAGHNLVNLVVDDGSSVDVQGYLNSYQREFHDQRVRYIRRERKGGDLHTSSNAINIGLDACIMKSSDVFTVSEANDLYAATFLHSDDLLTKDSVEGRVSQLGNAFVFSDMADFDEQGKLVAIRRWNKGSNPNELLSPFNVYHFNYHTVMWQIGFLQRVGDYVKMRYQQDGVFDPSITQCEDTDAVLSSAEAAAAYNSSLTYIPFVSVFYRMHKNSITGLGSTEERNLHHSFMFKKHFGIDDSYLLSPLYLFSRMMSDYPWSFFTFLPEAVKVKLRPMRNNVKSFSIGYGNNQLKRELEACLVE